jgi:hypothetical protein
LASFDAPGNGRISVSQETLRAELAEMELRLIKSIGEQIADKASQEELRALRHDVRNLEAQVPLQGRITAEFLDVQKEVQGLRAWQAKIIGGLAVISMVVGVLASYATGLL